MQLAQDSFYVTLRDRLAALNPERTVVLDGVTRPAVIVAENQAATAAPPLPQAFYLAWGETQPVAATQAAARPLMQVTCVLGYRTRGSPEGGGLDRGRCLCTLDGELLAICSPPRAAKQDHTQAPCADLGSCIFWTRPRLAEAERMGGELRRRASLTLFFFAEVDF